MNDMFVFVYVLNKKQKMQAILLFLFLMNDWVGVDARFGRFSPLSRHFVYVLMNIKNCMMYVNTFIDLLQPFRLLMLFNLSDWSQSGSSSYGYVARSRLRSISI